MKKYNHVYEKMLTSDAILNSYRLSRKNKASWVTSMVDENPEYYLKLLQNMLKNKDFKTSEYEIFYKYDSGKLRKIANLPYFPDRIAQCDYVINVIEPIWLPVFIEFTYAAIPGRGPTKALKQLQNYLKTDCNGTQQVLKLDIKKYFDSIDKNILKEIYSRKLKDKDALDFAFEIIDSWTENGIPIGNYTSQYFGNIYLSYFDHWVKEVLKVKYYLRYMDDMIILTNSKERAWYLYNQINEYLTNNLKLTLKPAQPHLVEDRGVDFVGYRSFHNYSLIRNKTKRKIKHKTLRINQKLNKNNCLDKHDKGVIASYNGSLKWGNCYRLRQCTIDQFQKYL